MLVFTNEIVRYIKNQPNGVALAGIKTNQPQNIHTVTYYHIADM